LVLVIIAAQQGTTGFRIERIVVKAERLLELTIVAGLLASFFQVVDGAVDVFGLLPVKGQRGIMRQQIGGAGLLVPS
jgi:hypothetical protein